MSWYLSGCRELHDIVRRAAEEHVCRIEQPMLTYEPCIIHYAATIASCLSLHAIRYSLF
jgi:hypothetical protein